jgi:hypothetical protein
MVQEDSAPADWSRALPEIKEGGVVQVGVAARDNYSVKTAEDPAVRVEEADQAEEAAPVVVAEAGECSEGAGGSDARR